MSGICYCCCYCSGFVFRSLGKYCIGKEFGSRKGGGSIGKKGEEWAGLAFMSAHLHSLFHPIHYSISFTLLVILGR